MSEVGHDLHALFPTRTAILHKLKLESERFRTLAQRHHELAQQIGRIEAGLDAASDDRLDDLKKQRLVLLDDIAGMIAQDEEA